jgi:hypothetical protein
MAISRDNIRSQNIPDNVFAYVFCAADQLNLEGYRHRKDGNNPEQLNECPTKENETVYVNLDVKCLCKRG